MKAVQETRTSAAALPFAETLGDLELAETAAQHRRWLENNASTRAASASLFQGLKTDWSVVKSHIASTADEAAARAATYRHAAEQMRGYNLAALLREDLPAWHERLAARYREAVRILEEELARDVAILEGARWTPETLSLAVWLRDLQAALNLRACEKWRETSAASHAHHFGRHFDGARTDWKSVLDALGTCREIVAHCRDKNCVALQKVLCVSGESIAPVAAQNARLKTVLTALQNAMKSLHAVFPLRDFPFADQPLAHIALPDLRDFLSSSNAALADFFVAYDQSGARASASFSQRQSDLAEGAAVAQERAALNDLEDEGRALFGHFFEDAKTDWEKITTALDWSARVLAWFGTNPIPAETLAAATDADARDALHAPAEKLRACHEAIGEDWDFVARIFPEWKIGERPCEFALLADGAAWLEERAARLDELEEWLAWQRLEAASTRAGLAGFLECALREKPAAAQLESAFWRRFWALWLDAARHAAPELAHFAGVAHDDDIEQFRALDEASLQSAQTRLAAALAKGRPSAGMARAGEVAVLQKEAVKKARHKPLRQLFAEIPNVLQALKPCMLMSPLSVAQFLQPDKVRFDLVIFDEASQICSEDAVGAIMRGSQLIVVGDRKQLPPSRFFGGSLEDDEDGENEGGEVYESILDECATMGLPDRMLRWHYRSRNEELIAFSNQHFYESNLVTFPGPHPIGTGVRGVSFEKVGGTYIRGKTKDARTNPIEARRVVELALEHFEQTPQQSLGIIAFNEAQMRAILGEVHRLAAARPHLDAFLNAEGPDSFFVKNLENVQGDERDVILFSIGYGPDQNGSFSMNFGPLNRAGGERRLNVAVTRAKLRVHIVASFEPEEIRQERVSAQGPKLLAQYLAFAKNGGIWNGANGAVSADAVQESIARVLAARGWKVQRQVGFSELRIDLAVQDPDDADSFLLGIECDGESYVSAQTARDRDRLRDQVLCGLGWRLLRVWTPDWIANQDAEVARIERALHEAQAAARRVTQVAAAVAAVAPPDYGTQALASAAAPMPPTVVLPMPPGAPPNAMPTLAPHDTASLTAPVSAAAQTRVLAAPVASALPAGAAWHRESALPYQGAPDAFYKLAKNRPSGIVLALAQVVEEEGPLHITAATRRVVAAWGMNRAGGKLLAILEDAARRAQGRNLLQRRGDFLWPPKMQTPPVRVPQLGAAPRAVEEIALEEVAEAAFLCVRDCFALSREELLHQTARLLGFKQTGANVRARIEESLRVLASDPRVECEDETFTIVP